jgi:RimJ/RimL family protein N-acetyltransferase
LRTRTSIRLETSRLILRRFRKSDLESFLAYRNDPEVARYQSWDSISRSGAEKFIAYNSRNRPGTPGKWFQFAVEVKADGALAGDCALLIAKSTPRMGEIGYTFARSYQGKGLATEAVRAMVDFALHSMRLNRVIATMDCRNARSIALTERLGMRREGHFIQNVWFKGKWCDEYLYAVLRDEWLRNMGPHRRKIR